MAVCLLCVARHVSSFGMNTLAATTRRSALMTAVRAEPTAAEKAVELRARAEEAKKRAEELMRVAEEKTEAVMVAIKNASDKQEEAAAARMPAPAPVANKASARVVDPGMAIIPINRENVEFASGVLALGTALAFGASPVFAVVAAAAVNYVSRKDDLGELNELVQAISKASLSTFNWFAKLDSKYTLLGKLSESLENALGELKNSNSESAETYKKIEETVLKTTEQISKLATEIDLLDGGKQALGAVGEVIETSIDKALDANKEYNLTERAVEAAKKAIKKATELNN